MSVAITAQDLPDSAAANRRLVALWLFMVAALIIAMITVGGLTRLTESGLSMVEWKPITGWLPPLTEQAWLAEFEKYRQTPEYLKVNKGFGLEGFKQIYWLEYWHRVLGRVIGLVVALPLLFFIVTRRIERPLIPRLVAILVLLGLQGALGWFMVQSGLVDRPSVSHYRLTMHLGLAVALFALVLKTALDLRYGPQPGRNELAWWVTAAVFAQILLGGLVAGLDAALVYNTWPMMGETFAPPDLWSLSPVWLNPLENPSFVQFQHRIGAYFVTVMVFWLWWRDRRGATRGTAHLLVGLVLAQVAVGVDVVLGSGGGEIPIAGASAHQVLGVLLFGVVLLHAWRGRPS